MAKGVLVFNSLRSALNAGYMICDRTSTGYTVRTRTARGWAMAVVVL
jgi:hypothetical protein